MIERKDVGSWLEGPRSRTAVGEYPGQRLGMPQSGPGAIGRFGRRVGGVVIDWLIASVIARGMFGVPLPFADPPASQTQGFVVLGIFAVMHLVLVGTLGTTIGHRLVGLRVTALGGGRATLLQAFVRTVLLCLFVPAVIWDRDGRGMHDRVPNTVIVRTR